MESQLRQTDIDTAYAGVKNPQRVTVAVCRDPAGKPNAITLEWFMRTSIKPLMFAISIGHTRYSYECLQRERFFNLVFPSAELRDWTILCGTRSGRDLDKFAEVSHFPGRLAQLPVLRQAAAVFECEIVTQVRSGDHTIFVGEVRYAWATPGSTPLLSEQLF
jgi:flavin reductase (DIM6/NTAB) family NADH-FMN oxidoreductase RutF